MKPALIQIDPSLKKQLKARAKKEGYKLFSFLNKIVKEFLEKDNES